MGALNYYQVVWVFPAFQLVFFALLRISKIYTVASNKSSPLFFLGGGCVGLFRIHENCGIQSPKTDQQFAL